MDDSTFVRWAYLDRLERPVDEQGFAANMAWLAAGGPRSQVYTNLTDSPEGRQVIAGRRSAFKLVPYPGYS